MNEAVNKKREESLMSNSSFRLNLSATAFTFGLNMSVLTKNCCCSENGNKLAKMMC